MTALADDRVNVLQAVNLTAGTAAFLAIADALPKLFGPPPSSALGAVATPVSDTPASDFIGQILLVTVLVFWAVKLLVENHKSFAGSRLSRSGYAIFQLSMTIIMFLALIVSGKNIDNLIVSTWWLMISLAAGLVWLFVLGCSFGSAFNYKIYPWQWVGSALVTVGACALISFNEMGFGATTTILALAAILVAGVIDIFISKSFS